MMLPLIVALLLVLSPWLAAAETRLTLPPTALPWIDVTKAPYGAKCDNTTDDAVAIQAALTAVPATGGMVLIPGQCVTSVSLVPNAETTIAGLNSTRSRIRFTSVAAGAILINATSKPRVHVQNLTLQVNGNTQIGFEAKDSPESIYTNVVWTSAVVGNGIGLRVRSTGSSGSFQGNVFASRFENLATGTYLGVIGDGSGANVWSFFGTKWTSNGTGLMVEVATAVNVFGGRWESNTAYGVDSSNAGGATCANVQLVGGYFESNTTNHFRIQAACTGWLITRPTTVGGTYTDNGALTAYIGEVQGTAALIEQLTGGNFLSQISQTGLGFFTTFRGIGTALASLGTPANGTFAYCSNCDPAPAGLVANCTAAGAQTGALAIRINGVWRCAG